MPENARQLFVKRLREIMSLRGVSQVDFVNAIGVSAATVSEWCKGRKMPRMDKIQMIADVLNVPISALLEEDGMQDMLDQDRLEALHQNPELGMLFDRQRNMSKEDIDKMMKIVDAIFGERDTFAE